DIIDGGAGDDTITDTGGSDTISGGIGSADSLSFSGTGTGISSATFNDGTDVTVTNSNGDIDDIDGIEDFTLTDSDDSISIDATNLSDFGTIDGAAGTDTVAMTTAISGLTGYTAEGSDMASVFTNIEELDISSSYSTSLAFDITESDIDTLTGSSTGVLTIQTNGDLDSVDVASYDSFTDNGTNYQYGWADGTTLIVQS
ncbi:MAG TPA: hypothetical protein DIU06_03975, partial [Rhodospirillaceae bacterium]|nr:hypothetical protein [Rhodospirillaceae bacterium]